MFESICASARVIVFSLFASDYNHVLVFVCQCLLCVNKSAFDKVIRLATILALAASNHVHISAAPEMYKSDHRGAQTGPWSSG